MTRSHSKCFYLIALIFLFTIPLIGLLINQSSTIKKYESYIQMTAQNNIQNIERRYDLISENLTMLSKDPESPENFERAMKLYSSYSSIANSAQYLSGMADILMIFPDNKNNYHSTISISLANFFLDYANQNYAGEIKSESIAKLPQIAEMNQMYMSIYSETEGNLHFCKHFTNSIDFPIYTL